MVDLHPILCEKRTVHGKKLIIKFLRSPHIHKQLFRSQATSQNKLRRRTLKTNRTVKLISYFLVFGIVVGLVYNGHATDSIVVAERQTTASPVANITSSKPSIDQVAASHLAANLASGVNLPIASNVTNQAISIAAKSELSQTSDELISKPQIIQPTTGHGLTIYIAKAGDTVDSVAAQFKLTKETIKWSNDLQSDALEPGRELTIPPVDGLVYTAQSGDTGETVAQKFGTDAQRIILFNDLELNNAITAGTRVIVPGGKIAAAATPATTSRSGSSQSRSSNTATFSSAGNRYDYGYCTWYAYNRRAALGKPIGSFWGDATSWASGARADGFLVNTTPSVGAVMQDSYRTGYWGHVAVVESMNPDGSITVSEMNYSHWGPPSTSRTLSASEASSYNYIH